LPKPFEAGEDMATIQNRLKDELSRLESAVKAITNPATYPVIFQ
jgi:hypothetical protein